MTEKVETIVQIETHLSKYIAAYRTIKSAEARIYLFKFLLDFLGAALF